jgi:LysR family transcriptional regulator, low CO2-responsive transcriptional regulator
MSGPLDLDRAITLHQLRTFRAVADHLGFSAAATELRMSQPSVSYQVKELEQVLGVTLLDRQGKRVRPTQAGSILYDYARKILNLVDEAALAIEELRGMERGSFRVGASNTVGIYVIPTALGVFKKLHPELQLSLEIGSREQLQARVMGGELDVAVLNPPTGEEELESVQFMEDELVMVVPSGHRLAGGRGLTLADFQGEPFLMREPASDSRQKVEELATRMGVRLNVTMELGSNGAIKHAVEGGLGVAVLSRHAVTLERSAGGLVVVEVEGFPIHRPWCAIYLRRRRVPAPIAAFLDLLRGGSWLPEPASP